MDVADLLVDLYGRIPPVAQEAVKGLSQEQLVTPPAAGANTIAWLIWHLARVEDSHGSELLDIEQLWIADGWAERFGLDPDPHNHGYGHTAEQVLAVRPESADLLLDYFDASHERTVDLLRAVTPDDLDRIIDRNWDPPVTMGVRLISVADDCLQHAGQAAYVRGILERAATPA